MPTTLLDARLMSPSPYLDMLDVLLRQGLEGASDAFLETQARFVAGCQQPDGGFRGRQGGSDLYYTDFALRCLALLSPGHAAFARARDYLASQQHPPASIVDGFSFLNAHRLLNAQELNGKTQKHLPYAFEPEIRERLRRHLLPQGGFARSPGEASVSAYQTFLAALCLQLLGESIPSAADAVAAIENLQLPEGGFAEFSGQIEPQTNATAAATAFLMMQDALDEEDGKKIARFLAKTQSADGGLTAHAAIDAGDLLSTFTGSLTLTGFESLGLLDTRALAAFVKQTAAPQGGFLACLGDDAPDVEYTYYGLATFSLLRQFLQGE